MKRTFSALAVTVLAAGLAVVGATAPASANDEAPAISDDCLTVNIDLTGYAVDPGTDAEYRPIWVYKPVHGSMEHISYKDAGPILVYDWTLYYLDRTDSEQVKDAIAPVPNTATVVIDGELVAENAQFDAETGEYHASFELRDRFAPNSVDVSVTGYGIGTVSLPTYTVDACSTPQLLVAGDLKVGGAIVVTGTGFAPNTDLVIELHSDPLPLGTVTTDAEGAFSLDTAIPTSAEPGDHEVVALSDGEQLAATPVTIAAAPETVAETGDGDEAEPAAVTAPAATKAGLAETGFDGVPFAIGALALFAAGALALGASRAVRTVRSRD